MSAKHKVKFTYADPNKEYTFADALYLFMKRMEDEFVEELGEDGVRRHSHIFKQIAPNFKDETD